MKLKRSHEGEDISKRTIKNYSTKKIVADIKSGITTTISVDNAPPKVVSQPATGDPKVSIANFAPSCRRLLQSPPATASREANDDGAPHTNVQGQLFLLRHALSRKTYSRTFDQPGSHDYFCSIHN
jgi:hypothetical protein